MRRFLAVAAVFCALWILAEPAFSGEKTSAPSAAVSTVAPSAGAEASATQSSDQEKRLELAKKLHEVQPASAQVARAIDQVSQQLPPQDRESFKAMMMKSIDGDKLEKMSIAAMVDIFTLAELERMYGYFSSVEARGIADKMPVYNSRLQPEIAKMIDAALMAARTGTSAPPNAARKTP